MIDKDPEQIKLGSKKSLFTFQTIQEEFDEESKHQESQENLASIKTPVETEQEQMINDSIVSSRLMIRSPVTKRVKLHDNFISDFLNSDHLT